jgi:RND family efflux transporter MFP subunit
MRIKTRPYAILAALLVLNLSGCDRQTQTPTRSIEEIQQTDGVPVVVRPVDLGTFRNFLRFTSSLTGAEESTAKAMVTDEVAGVLYQVGDYVEQGTAVVLFPPDNPSLNYEQARLSYEAARQTDERMRRLYQDDGVSQQDYDNARTQFEIARANWESVQKMTRVAAPISGYITRISVFESDNVDNGDALFTISDYQRLKTTVWLTDRQVEQVSVGQPATAIWQDHALNGQVVQVDIAMDQERKAFAAKLRFENPGLEVRSGVTATVEIETHRSQDAILVSQTEVRSDDRGSYVFTVEDGRAVRRYIQIARSQGLIMTIAAGLEPGMKLVTVGIDQLDDGLPVRIMQEAPRLVQR